MKTPMQDLIEKLKSQKERQISLMKNQLMIDTVDAVFTYAIETAESMLEKEKEVMKSCIMMGLDFIPVDPNKYNEDADEIYNETFNTKEK